MDFLTKISWAIVIIFALLMLPFILIFTKLFLGSAITGKHFESGNPIDTGERIEMLIYTAVLTSPYICAFILLNQQLNS